MADAGCRDDRPTEETLSLDPDARENGVGLAPAAGEDFRTAELGMVPTIAVHGGAAGGGGAGGGGAGGGGAGGGDDHVRAGTLPHGADVTHTAPGSGPAVKINDVIDSKIVLRKLGEGSFGVAFEAQGIEDHKRYCIKLSKQGWPARDPAGALSPTVSVVRDEIRQLVNLPRHPNLQQYIGSGRHVARNGFTHIFIVSEILSGGSLRDCLPLGGGDVAARVTAAGGARAILRDLAAGLAALHWQPARRGADDGEPATTIIHGDLKPDNVMRSAEGAWKLVDFGSAVQARVGEGAEAHRNSTRAYISQTRHIEHKGSPADDVWALGMIALELVLGRSLLDLFPELGEDEGWFPYLHLDKLDALIQNAKTNDMKLGAIVERMLDPRSQHRLTAEEVLEALGEPQEAITEVVEAHWHARSEDARFLDVTGWIRDALQLHRLTVRVDSALVGEEVTLEGWLEVRFRTNRGHELVARRRGGLWLDLPSSMTTIAVGARGLALLSAAREGRGRVQALRGWLNRVGRDGREAAAVLRDLDLSWVAGLEGEEWEVGWRLAENVLVAGASLSVTDAEGGSWSCAWAERVRARRVEREAVRIARDDASTDLTSPSVLIVPSLRSTSTSSASTAASSAIGPPLTATLSRFPSASAVSPRFSMVSSDRRLQYFVGRADLVRAIESQMSLHVAPAASSSSSSSSSSAANPTWLLYGEGGMGKSTVALLIAQGAHSREEVDWVFVVDASTEATIEQSLRSIARRTLLPEKTERDELSSLSDDVVDFLKLQTERRVLVVVDNLDHARFLDSRRSPWNACLRGHEDAKHIRVLITSRLVPDVFADAGFLSADQAVHVDEMSEDDGIAMVEAILGSTITDDVERAALRRLIGPERLGGLPLAIRTAALSMTQNRVVPRRERVRRYLASWEEERATILDASNVDDLVREQVSESTTTVAGTPGFAAVCDGISKLIRERSGASWDSCRSIAAGILGRDGDTLGLAHRVITTLSSVTLLPEALDAARVTDFDRECFFAFQRQLSVESSLRTSLAAAIEQLATQHPSRIPRSSLSEKSRFEATRRNVLTTLNIAMNTLDEGDRALGWALLRWLCLLEVGNVPLPFFDSLRRTLIELRKVREGRIAEGGSGNGGVRLWLMKVFEDQGGRSTIRSSGPRRVVAESQHIDETLKSLRESSANYSSWTSLYPPTAEPTPAARALAGDVLEADLTILHERVDWSWWDALGSIVANASEASINRALQLMFNLSITREIEHEEGVVCQSIHPVLHSVILQGIPCAISPPRSLARAVVGSASGVMSWLWNRERTLEVAPEWAGQVRVLGARGGAGVLDTLFFVATHPLRVTDSNQTWELGSSASEHLRDLSVRWRAFVENACSLAPHHPLCVLLTSTTLQILGDAHLDLSSAKPVIEHLRLALDRLDRTHEQTLALRSNYAFLLKASGESSLALGEFRAIRDTFVRSSLGRETLESLKAMENVASVLQELGFKSDAQEELRAVLAVRNRVQGSSHLDTLSTRQSIASIDKSLGNYHVALREFQDVLAAREGTLGLDHLATLESRNSVACALKLVGGPRLVEALDCFRSLLPVSERKLGIHHSRTVSIRCNIAAVLEDLGSLEEALDEYHTVLALEQRTRRPDDPSVFETRLGIATVLHKQGKLSESEAELRRLVDDQSRVQGPTHVDVLHTRKTLAELLRDKRDFEGAISELNFVLEVLVAQEGRDSIPAFAVRLEIAKTLFAQGKRDEAIEFGRTLLADQERALGPDHERTRKTRTFLDELSR